MAETTAVFKISVDSAQAVQAMAEYSRKIEEIKNEEKTLREEIKKSGEMNNEQAQSLVRLAEERKAYTRALQEYSKEVQNNMRQAKEQNGSLKSLRAELSNLTKQYDELGKAEREGMKGEELKERINEVTNTLKEAEEATQRYYRNVGNYEGALSSFFGATAANAGQSVVGIKNMIKESGGVIAAFKAMGAAANTALGPIGIIVMAVVAVFKVLKSAIAGSEESSNKAKEAFAFLTIIFDGLKKSLEYVANGFITVVGWIGKAINKIFGIKSATSQYNEALKEQNRLVKENRELNERSADAELEIAKLRDKASDKLNYTAKQRLAFLKEAGEKEKKLAEDRYNIAKREYENIKLQNSLTQSSAEDNEKLSQAYVKMVQAETAFYNKKKELNAQMAEATNQIVADAKTAAEKLKKIREAELEDIEAAIDAMLDLYEDGYAKDIALANEQYRRKKAALQKRLREESDLTVKQRKAINDQIEALTRQHEKDITRIKKEEAQERKDILLSIEEEIDDAEVAMMAEGVDKELALSDLQWERKKKALVRDFEREKNLRLQNIANLNLLLAQATSQEDKDLYKSLIEKDKAYIAEYASMVEEQISNLAALQVSEKTAIVAKYDKLAKEANDKAAAQRAKDTQLNWQNEIQQAQNRNEEWLDLQLEWKEQEYLALKNAQKREDESNVEFRARQLQAEKEYIEAKKAIKDKEWEDYAKEVEKWETMGTAISSLGQIVEQFGEDSRAAAIASKALALGEIAVQTGVAIAKGVSAAAAAGPFPANIVAILTTVATVLGNIASATSIVKSAKFSTGGYVSGPGTGTSDSIPARLSNGESVLNARATSMFAPILSPLNQMGGGIPIVATQSAAQVQGEEMLARAFAKGLKDIDIRVGVDEISRVQNRVKVIERMGTL